MQYPTFEKIRPVKFNTTLSRFDSKLWGHHISVPDDVSQHFLDKDAKRFVCTFNDTVSFQCALMPKGNGSYFINVNKEVRTKLHLRVGMEVAVELKKDESKYGLPMPEEFEELLYQDPEGNELFHALTPGKQRNLLYIVGKPKNTETRLKKAIVVIEHLKVNQGKIDFKRLNEDMKNANQI